MCPSTEERQVLSVDFIDGCESVATLKIACLGSVPKRSNTGSRVPQYVDLENSVNIETVEDKDDIDPLIGIQVYCGNDPYLSPILLSEETEYEIEIDPQIRPPGGSSEIFDGFQRYPDSEIQLFQLGQS